MMVKNLTDFAEEQIVSTWLTPDQGLAITTFRVTDGMEEASAVVIGKKDHKAFLIEVESLIKEAEEVLVEEVPVEHSQSEEAPAPDLTGIILREDLDYLKKSARNR